jgi:hypothetical protein
MVSQLLQVRWHQLHRIPGRRDGSWQKSASTDISPHGLPILYAQAVVDVDQNTLKSIPLASLDVKRRVDMVLSVFIILADV